jgi:ribosomal protein L11 methyltransferase
VPQGQEELATAVLWECGTAGVEERGAVLLAYFEERAGLEEELRAALGGGEVQEVPVPEVDWVARFREGFRALRAGGFEIVPEWEAGEARSDRLIVDPGRAFGTGTHETTRLCLGAIEALAAEGALGRALDVGTGTGLLALAAARRGADLVVGVDNDPEAVASAARHARLNAVDLRLVLGDGAAAFRARSFDLVLANLTAPLLLAQREALAAVVRPGGTVVLSGLLLDDEPAVRAAYDGLGAAAPARDGEWASLVIRAGAP